MIARFAADFVRDAMEDTPVVLLHGPRQCGKSTVAQAYCADRGVRYLTLDDGPALDLARTRPDEFVATYRPPIAIDEIQRAPGLFLAMKAQIDRDRRPGSYLLTGSANVLQLPRVADSLAGRMEVVDLAPLSQAELEGSRGGIIDHWFAGEPSPSVASPVELVDRVVRGGFPEPVSRSPRRRGPWFESYVRTLLERDVRDLANIEGLAQVPRLLTLLATRSGEVANVSALSRETTIAPTTMTRYLDLLRALFLTLSVPAWSSVPDVRLIKAPKLYLVDSGVLCHLARWGDDALRRDEFAWTTALRTFVANELARGCAISQARPWLLHLRTVRNKEVDFVLERPNGDVVGVVVRPTETVTLDDAEGLRWLGDVVGNRFRRGVVLYAGSESRPLAPHVEAAPIASLWA